MATTTDAELDAYYHARRKHENQLAANFSQFSIGKIDAGVAVLISDVRSSLPLLVAPPNTEYSPS